MVWDDEVFNKDALEQSVIVKTFFDSDTSTFTHIVWDEESLYAAIIDPVLNYNPASGRITTTSADQVIEFIKDNKLTVQWLLETHVHADHLTALSYLKEKLGGKSGIGKKITDVLAYWSPIFNLPFDGSQFDVFFEDNQIFKIGNLECKVIFTPGHTPACVSYLIENSVFVGDTLFMPDVGTSRTDFPGGSAEMLYDSIQRLFLLPKDTKIYMCHDYPPASRELSYCSSIREELDHNILIHEGISKAEYTKVRNEKDFRKEPPRLLLPSLQINLRAGMLISEKGIDYLKIPLNKL